ncbi:MAG: rod shape-determining protein MreC, partial [Syntrophales bacterium]
QPAETGMIRKIILELSAPLETAVHGINRCVHDAWNRYVFLIGLGDENHHLREQNDLLKQRIIQYQEAYMEAARLRRLLELKNQLNLLTAAAGIIGTDRTSIFRTVLIDKGTIQGLQSGLAVVSDAGVIGRIMDVSWNVSRVLLIIDENSNVDALVQGSRAQGILQGGGSRACSLKYVSITEDVRPGMAVITSGIGGVFPKGLLLGVVTKVSKKEGGLFQAVDVAPAIDFGKLEEVLVLLESGQDMSQKSGRNEK